MVAETVKVGQISRMPWLVRPLAASLCVLFACLSTACDPSSPFYGGSGDTASTGGSGDSGNGDEWFVVGQGEFEYSQLDDGTELEMVLGGQGLLMFPMPIRGEGFRLPDDPKDYTHPDTPILDMYLDIEGYNIGFGGHFARIANYPLPFDILANGTYEFIYVTIFVPDELVNPCDIDELPGFLHAELETADGNILVFERDLEIEVPSDLGDGCFE